MANELVAQSSSRLGATVLWVTIHTAEGPTDAYPTDPNRDPGSAQALLRFFQGKTDRSCHAIADDDVLLDNLVPYERAAWTLRGGNRYSDNLEMCGLASWSRDEWLTHKRMLELAARWVSGRLKARGLAKRRLTVGQVAAKSAAGYIDHWTYTRATGDGTHWDVGDGFPWDYFGARVTANLTGTGKEDDMATVPDSEWGEVLKAARAINATAVFGSTGFESTVEGMANKVNLLINEVRANANVTGDDEASITAKLAELKSLVETLAQPAPPVEPPATT